MYKLLNRKVGVFILLFCSAYCCAQQDSQFTQYMYNTINVNPAYAGSRNAISIVGLHRSQWIGLDGAPVTQTFSIQTPLGELNRVGLGVSFINDVIGPTSETNFNIDFSYSLPFSSENILRLGLKVSGHLMGIDFSKLSLYDINDEAFQNNIENRFSPNIGAGIYYSGSRFYIGLSVPNFLETEYFNHGKNSSSLVNKEKMHVYMISGYVMDFNEYIKFKPALMTKMVIGSPLQVDLSANFLFYDRFVLGAAYRWSASLSALAGMQISPNLFAGFAYDKETTALGNTSFNDGSVEIILRYEFVKKEIRRWTPRFF